MATVVTFATTLVLHSVDDSGYFTKLAAMVAFACFVLNIEIIGAIFNLTPTQNALVSWCADARLLAYTHNLRLLLAAGLACIGAFIAARTCGLAAGYWSAFAERPESLILAALVVFASPYFVRQDRFDGFAPIYRVLGLLVLFGPLLVLSEHGRVSYFEIDHETIQHGYQVLGLLGAGVGVWLGVRFEWPDTVNTSVVAFIAFLCAKFYDWWWEAVPKSVFFLLLGLTALLALFMLRRFRSGRVPAAAGAAR